MKTRIIILFALILLSVTYAEGQYRSNENKASVGVNLGAGLGFEKFTIFYDENGDDIYLSSGGGFSGGIDFGYDIAKVFNLSMQLFYQSSSPSKMMKNASGNFNRMGIAVTPAFVIPIGGGEMFRLMPGAGVGYYTLAVMKIDATEIGGDYMTFKYNSSVGFHASLMFQIKFSPHSAMQTGLKYYNIAYSYTEDGSTHVPYEQKLLEPNGSGLDVIIGYSYLF